MKRLLLPLIFIHFNIAHADMYINFMFFNNNKDPITRAYSSLPADSSLQDFEKLIIELIKKQICRFPYINTETPDLCFANREHLFTIKKSEYHMLLKNKIGNQFDSVFELAVFPRSVFFEHHEFQIPELNIEKATPEEIAVVGKKFLFPIREGTSKTPAITINNQEITDESWEKIVKYYNTKSDDHFLLTNNQEKISIVGLRIFGGREQTKKTILKSLSDMPNGEKRYGAPIWPNQNLEHLSLLTNNTLFKYSDLVESKEITIDEDSELIFYSIVRGESIRNFITRIVKMMNLLQNLNGYDHYRINTALFYAVNYCEAYMADGTAKDILIAFLKTKYFPTFELKIRAPASGNRSTTRLFRLILPEAMTFDQAVAAATKYLIDHDFDISDCDPKIVDIMGKDGEGDSNTAFKHPSMFMEFRRKVPAEGAPLMLDSSLFD